MDSRDRDSFHNPVALDLDARVVAVSVWPSRFFAGDGTNPLGQIEVQQGCRDLLVGTVSEVRDRRVCPGVMRLTLVRLEGFFNGRETIVDISQDAPEQEDGQNLENHEYRPPLIKVDPVRHHVEPCFLDPESKVPIPQVRAYQGRPRSMPAPLMGSHAEVGLNNQLCYDRLNRFGPYRMGTPKVQAGLGSKADGDIPGTSAIPKTISRQVKWGEAQRRCSQKNSVHKRPRTAVVIRTWHDLKYTPQQILMLRAMISELALASGGEYTVHFLIHVRDESLAIWTSDEVYARTLREALPPEFEGMGTLWSVPQMREVYPPPFPESVINFSGADLYSVYRSLHFAVQHFAAQHPEFDYFWQWEMDIRVTGHYYELLDRVTQWAQAQPREYLWERSSRFFIPALHNASYSRFGEAVKQESQASRARPISGPQLPPDQLLPIPAQPGGDDDSNDLPEVQDEITDLIVFNPLFNPEKTRWAFHDDITGYPRRPRPPTRASLITASRLSRRLLLLMHAESALRKHTMFPEMFPASVCLHYGLKAVYVPVPVYFDRAWPAGGQHVDEVFNNAPIGEEGRRMGMTDHGGGRFHGVGGSVFGPGEHVFRGATYYSNADFAGELWRAWLGRGRGRDEDRTAGGEEDDDDDDERIVKGDADGDDNDKKVPMNATAEGEGTSKIRTGRTGRMCLPMMVLHPIKHE